MSGWIKIDREITECPMWANSEMLKTFIYFSFRAAFKQQHISVKTGEGETIVTIEKGQLIYGRLQASKDLKLAPSKVERFVKKLIEMKAIRRKSFKHYSIFEVLNYTDNQVVTNHFGQPPNNHQTTTEQPPDTYKNDKKEKKDKNNNIEGFKIAAWGQIKAAFQTISKAHIPEADNKHFIQIVYDLRESIKAARKAKGEMPTVCDDDIIKAAKYIIANYPTWAKKEPSYFRYNFSNITSHIREAHKAAPKGNGKGKRL